MHRVDVGQRSETVRRANLSAIVRELHAHGPLSRSELVTRTGLTRSAIRGLIGELATAGLASERRAASLGVRGRPSPLVGLRPDAAVVLALEIAVDSLAAGLVGLGGVVFERVRSDRPRGHSSVDEISADLGELAQSVRGRPSSTGPLIGIGVSIVGVVRRSDGLVSMAPNLGWIDVPFGDRLRDALLVRLGEEVGGVPIWLANDADLGALAELRRGAAVGADSLVFIAGEVGVGGGLIIDGKPLTGIAGYGGEVGHMPLNPGGVACRCGSTGCWETEVGEEALLRRAGHPPEGGRAHLEAILGEAAQGSEVARGALDHVGRWLGRGLAALVNLLNPRLVVLGGRFAEIYPWVIAPLEAELDRLTLPAPRLLVRVVPTTLGADAPLLGAAELAFESLLADPAAWIGPRERVAELVGA